MKKPVKRPLGVTVIAVGLIITSLLQITACLDFKNYWYLLQDWPGEFLPVRYFLSWTARLLAITAAIGLLRGKEWGRKIICMIMWFTIFMVYWKHPYPGFLLQMRRFDNILDGYVGVSLETLTGQSLATLALMSSIIICIQEVLLSSAILYYLTRPKVKVYFRA